MNNLKIIFIAFFLFTKARADILLVPDSTVQITDYQVICKKNNYLCFPDIYPQLIDKTHPLFDSLIEQFNIDDKTYLMQLDHKIKTILKSENISIEDLDQINFSLEKIKNQHPNINFIATQIKNIQTIKDVFSQLKIAENTQSESFIYIFQIAVENSEHNRYLINKYLSQVLFTVVEFDGYISNTNSQKIHFLNGTCEQPQYTSLIDSNLLFKKIPLFKNGCQFNEKMNWGGDLISDHFEKNKNKYYWGLGVLFGFILYQNHDFVFEYSSK